MKSKTKAQRLSAAFMYAFVIVVPVAIWIIILYL